MSRNGKRQDTQGGTTLVNRDVNAAQRAVLAIQLRASKMTYADIAKQCGYADASSCRKAILREMSRVVVTNVEELRHEELYMLDRLHTEMWALAMDKANTYRTYAADRVLAISEARRKLMGMDTPVDTNLSAGLVVVRGMPVGYLEEPPKPAIEIEAHA
jgi:hypothetical protein